MTSSASSAAWLPAVARSVRVRPAGRSLPPTARHRAPDVPGRYTIATPQDLQRSGRHAEAEYDRALFDPKRDAQDAFDWLGFGPTAEGPAAARAQRSASSSAMTGTSAANA